MIIRVTSPCVAVEALEKKKSYLLHVPIFVVCVYNNRWVRVAHLHKPNASINAFKTDVLL